MAEKDTNQSSASKTPAPKKPKSNPFKTVANKLISKTPASAKSQKDGEKQTAFKEKKDTPPSKSTSKPKKAPDPAASKKTDTKKKPTSAKKPLHVKFISGFLLRKMAKGGAMELGSNAEEVNRLNVFPIPDGDTGDNMRMTIDSGVAEMETVESNSLAEVMESFSHGMLLGARGNSGVILSQFFAGMAKGLETSKKADAATFGMALEMGVKQAYSSVMTPTEGTILTVAREAVEYAVGRLTPESTIHSLFDDLVAEMHESVNRTPERLSVLKEAGVVDSGAAGLLYIMEGFHHVLNGRKLPKQPASSSVAAPSTKVEFGPDSEMTYAYCTEVLLQLMRKKTDIDHFSVEELKEYLAGVGDSVVSFQTGSVVKVHVHTYTPEKVIAHLREFGEFLTVKIENMSVQHTALAETKGETQTADSPERKGTTETVAPSPIKKEYAVVSVSVGAGLEALFRELGADVIIPGGQTQNPSTQDFLEAFESLSAEHIFVFPNNGNIVMAAQQAADMYTNSQVHVVPTKSIGTGYVALSSLRFDSDNPARTVDRMIQAIASVETGMISPSVRDADLNGIHIEAGNTIGIIEKTVVVCEADRMSATRALVAKLLDSSDRSLLTVFCGADVDPSEKEEISLYITERYPDIELYTIDGGQSLYPFVLVAE